MRRSWALTSGIFGPEGWHMSRRFVGTTARGNDVFLVTREGTRVLASEASPDLLFDAYLASAPSGAGTTLQSPRSRCCRFA